jgi:hypothetical protein
VSTVPARRVALDLLGLAAVAAVLVAVYALVPLGVQRSLAFDHGDPRPYAPLTAAYVHATLPHLLSNLLAYVVTAGFAHWLCLASDGRRWFWRTTAAFLTVLPVLVNLTDWAVLSVLYPAVDLRALGFSGVAAGFGGMLPVALSRFVRVRFDRALGRAVGLGTALLVLQIVAFRVALGGPPPVVTGLVAVGLLSLAGWYVVRRGRPGLDVRRRETAWSAGVVVLVLVVIGAVVLSLFPRTDAVVRGGVLTGVVAHAAGFGWGVVLAVATGYATEDAG